MKKTPNSFEFPKELTKQSEKVWSYVLKRYSDHIFDKKRLINDQWNKAINLFEHVCKIRGIQPYKKTNEYIKDRLQIISKIYNENRKCKKCS